MISSEKGKRIFNEAKGNMYIYLKDFNEIFAGNPMFSSSVDVPQAAHNFLVDLDKLTFSETLKKYGGYPYKVALWRRGLRKIKNVCRRVIKYK